MLVDLLSDCGNFDKEGLRCLHLFDFFDQFTLIDSAPVCGGEALLKLFDTLFELSLIVVDRMHILSLLLELSVKVLDFTLNLLNLCETLLFLLIVFVEFSEELTKLISDRIATLLTFFHGSSGLVLLSNSVIKLILQLFDLLVDGGDLEMILGIIGLLEHLFGHGRHNRVNGHEQIIAAFAPFGKLILSKPRIKGLLGFERLILVRHFLALLIECSTCLLLLSGLLFLRFAITLVAIVVRCVYVIVVLIAFALRLISPAAITSGSSTSTAFVFFGLSSVLGCSTST